jgi:chorismate lyase
LISLCPGQFRVKVLEQRWRKMEPAEAEAMQLSHVRPALVRQVLLCCGDTPLVYARTVIPAVTLTGAQRRYAYMGTRPLGAMLFADRTMRREQVTVSRLPEGHPVLKRLATDPRNCNANVANSEAVAVWGRRSVFRVSAKPLLVSEFFLPAMIERLQHHRAR